MSANSSIKLADLLKMPENEQYSFLLESVTNDEQRLRLGLVLDFS